MRLKCIAAAFLLAATTGSADATPATLFDWSVSGEFVTGGGTLTATESGGQYLVDSISGSVSDSQLRNIITLLTPHQTYAGLSDIGGDNLIFPAPASIFLDSQGIVFSVGGVGSDPCPFASGCYMRIYYDPNHSSYELLLSNAGVNGVDFVLTAEKSASVPEPSTWAMMILGLAWVAFMAYPSHRRTARKALSSWRS